LTKVQAFAHGDRIELQSIDTNKTGSQVTLSVSNSTPSGPLTTFITASGPNFLDTIAWGYTTYQISGNPAATNTMNIVVTKTNNATVSLSVTNTAFRTCLVSPSNFSTPSTTAPPYRAPMELSPKILQSGGPTLVQFRLRARSTGIGLSQITANITCPGMTPNPAGIDFLNDNLGDLKPRAHLYITAGTSNLSFAFPFATTNLANGYHELAAVVYEGSHVHTQARAAQNIRIQNTALSATLNTLVGGSNSALEATLQFSVTPNTNTISKMNCSAPAAHSEPSPTNRLPHSPLPPRIWESDCIRSMPS